eukprot:616665-Amphidinium_carterae.1
MSADMNAMSNMHCLRVVRTEQKTTTNWKWHYTPMSNRHGLVARTRIHACIPQSRYRHTVSLKYRPCELMRPTGLCMTGLGCTGALGNIRLSGREHPKVRQPCTGADETIQNTRMSGNPGNTRRSGNPALGKQTVQERNSPPNESRRAHDGNSSSIVSPQLY